MDEHVLSATRRSWHAVAERLLAAGDAGHPAPYAHVGPWTPREGPFWNAPFGALRAAAELPDADAVAAWFAGGRAEVRA
jgi:hypothetical protein